MIRLATVGFLVCGLFGCASAPPPPVVEDRTPVTLEAIVEDPLHEERMIADSPKGGSEWVYYTATLRVRDAGDPSVTQINVFSDRPVSADHPIRQKNAEVTFTAERRLLKRSAFSFGSETTDRYQYFLKLPEMVGLRKKPDPATEQTAPSGDGSAVTSAKN